MFGLSEKEMQETEKLCDLFDRLRKYAREKNIKVIVATAGVQSTYDATDLTITWDHSEGPKVLDYLNLVRAKERPLSANLRLSDQAWDFAVPIGYSSMRDGVTQVMDGTDTGEIVESVESLLTKDNRGPNRAGPQLGEVLDQCIKGAADKYGLDPEMLKQVIDFENSAGTIKVPEPDTLESLIVLMGEEGNLPPDHLAVCLGPIAYRDDLQNMDVLETYPLVAPYHDHMVDGVPVGQKVVVFGGRMQGRSALLLAALSAITSQDTPMLVRGLDADFDGNVDDPHGRSGMVRYRSKSPGRYFGGFGGTAADTSVSGAEKRKWSDRKPNGRPKKGWEK